MEYFTLNNGRKIPAVGFGTGDVQVVVGGFEVEKVMAAYMLALECGYRNIDGARIYKCEELIGKAVQVKLGDNTVTREELFITSKVMADETGAACVPKAVQTSLKELKLSYLDLCLIHSPTAVWSNTKTGEWRAADAVDYLDIYKAFESLVDEGLVKSIGVSNFNRQQIERLLANCRIRPVVNQVELHPYLNQRELVAFCQENDIHVTAYSPLGMAHIYGPFTTVEGSGPIEDPVVQAIAKQHNKTAAQVLLRYQIERGVSVIPRSYNPQRMKENLQVFDFKLSSSDMDSLNSLDKDWRISRSAMMAKAKYYPF